MMFYCYIYHMFKVQENHSPNYIFDPNLCQHFSLFAMLKTV